MRLECTPAAGGQGGKPRPHPALVDVDRVERLPVPGHHLVVLLVERTERCLEELHEAASAADVLRRAPPLSVDERRVVDIGLAIANRFDEVVDEVQNLTLLETAVVVELCLAIARRRGHARWLVAAGDDGQTVRPSGFD